VNVVEHVERAAAADPDRTAILFEGTSVSYAALNQSASALAGALRLAGIRKGDRVAIYLPNIPAFALVYLATLRIGAIAVSLNAIFKSEEVKYILNDSGARVVFTTGELLPNVPRDHCPQVERLVNCEGVAPIETLGEWLAKGAPSAAAVAELAPGDPAALLYSSGTTGFPKGVTLSHRNIQSNVRATAKACGFRVEDRFTCFLPLFHVFAQNFIMNSCFEMGATLILWRRFVPDKVLADIGRERATLFFAVPTIYIALINAGVSPASLATVRYYFSAAATMPEEISRRWTERFGSLVYEGYGLTECAPCAAYNHVSQHRFGSVGTAIEDFELQIFDPANRRVPAGEWGEIVMRGPGVMLGYWNKPEETAQALRGGWLHSGDIGRMDDEGYVYIVDRVKDMINVSGFKVWPAEIENYLYRIPGVREVAVYGVPDAQKGESVRVAVVLNEGCDVTGDQVIAWCSENLAAYKTPARVDIVKELPKSATGKILKRVLREQAAEKSQARL
jgi:long-chain acyl-CoA synthetase